MMKLNDNRNTFGILRPDRVEYHTWAKLWLKKLPMCDDILILISEYGVSLVLTCDMNYLDGTDFDAVGPPIKLSSTIPNAKYPVDNIVIHASIEHNFKYDQYSSRINGYTYYDLLSDGYWRERADPELTLSVDFWTPEDYQYPRDGYFILNTANNKIESNLSSDGKCILLVAHYLTKIKFGARFRSDMFIKPRSIFTEIRNMIAIFGSVVLCLLLAR